MIPFALSSRRRALPVAAQYPRPVWYDNAELILDAEDQEPSETPRDKSKHGRVFNRNWAYQPGDLPSIGGPRVFFGSGSIVGNNSAAAGRHFECVTMPALGEAYSIEFMFSMAPPAPSAANQPIITYELTYPSAPTTLKLEVLTTPTGNMIVRYTRGNATNELSFAVDGGFTSSQDARFARHRLSIIRTTPTPINPGNSTAIYLDGFIKGGFSSGDTDPSHDTAFSFTHPTAGLSPSSSSFRLFGGNGSPQYAIDDLVVLKNYKLRDVTDISLSRFSPENYSIIRPRPEWWDNAVLLLSFEDLYDPVIENSEDPMDTMGVVDSSPNRRLPRLFMHEYNGAGFFDNGFTDSELGTPVIDPQFKRFQHSVSSNPALNFRGKKVFANNLTSISGARPSQVRYDSIVVPTVPRLGDHYSIEFLLKVIAPGEPPAGGAMLFDYSASADDFADPIWQYNGGMDILAYLSVGGDTLEFHSSVSTWGASAGENSDGTGGISRVASIQLTQPVGTVYRVSFIREPPVPFNSDDTFKIYLNGQLQVPTVKDGFTNYNNNYNPGYPFLMPETRGTAARLYLPIYSGRTPNSRYVYHGEDGIDQFAQPNPVKFAIDDLVILKDYSLRTGQSFVGENYSIIP